MKTTLEWPLIGSGDSVIIINEEVRVHCKVKRMHLCNQGGTASIYSSSLVIDDYMGRVFYIIGKNCRFPNSLRKEEKL